MKKNFKIYMVAWAAVLVLFQVITFVIPSFPEMEKYTASFWVGYILITITFLGQAVCSYMAFKADSIKKLFYNVSLIKSSYIGLLVSFVIGGLCMLISSLPYWVAIVLCTAVLVGNIIFVLKADAVVAEVEKIDEKVKTQTFFIKSLTVDADTLMASARTEDIRAECRKVYEAIRYSDPMSNDALGAVESQITLKFSELSAAVKANDLEKVTELAQDVLVLVGDRNKRCKILK